MLRRLFVVLFIILLLPLKSFAGEINIAFTIDSNYLVPALLTINSILKNNESNSEYTFYIVEEFLTEKEKKKLSDFVIRNNQKIEFIHYSNSIMQSSSPAYFNSSVTMSRVELPKMLPESVKKIIYLDADILVVSDLKPLYDIEIDNEYVGMVGDAAYLRRIYKDDCGFSYKNGYYNSGVMLINIDKWRKDHVTEQMIDFVVKNKNRFIESDSSVCSYRYPDQDLINRVLYGKIKSIDKNWNCPYRKKKTAYIYHFLGSRKPWKWEEKNRNLATYQYYLYWNKSSLKRYQYIYLWDYFKERVVNTYKILLLYIKIF